MLEKAEKRMEDKQVEMAELGDKQVQKTGK